MTNGERSHSFGERILTFAEEETILVDSVERTARVNSIAAARAIGPQSRESRAQTAKLGWMRLRHSLRK